METAILLKYQANLVGRQGRDTNLGPRFEASGSVEDQYLRGGNGVI